MRRKPAKPPGGPFKLDDYEIQTHREIFRGWHMDRGNILVYDPEPKQIIPKSGAWIMITRQLPPIEGGLDKKVRVGRIFYAWHHEDADEKGFRPTGLYMVRMVAPAEGGESARELSLYPYEYSALPIESILTMWTAGEIKFHPRNIDLAQLNAVVFYARSRGIALADAMVMALGTLNGDVGWFEPSTDELALDLEEMEQRVNRWKPTRKVKESMKITVVIA
jgi:hypothetical protein